ncbi:MAG: hypothetical protein JO061_02515, partial [Acidobacteriaceae bacterium]|nr:hypothetical protein [Acidobacteriaceae bacterium]
RVVWQHRTWGRANDPQHPWGATFYGENATLKVDVYGYDYIPEQGPMIHRDVTYEFEKYPEDRTEKDLERHVSPAIRYHMLDFLNAIDKRSRPIADIEQGHISTASCILANNALQLGRTLEWDPVRCEVVGDEEANKILKRQYRNPWVHPAASEV